MQTKVNIDVPIEIRNRIKEIDNLATEREYLITRLAELGFCLLEHPSAQKSVQISSGEPRAWKIGDAVITPHISQGKKNTLSRTFSMVELNLKTITECLHMIRWITSSYTKGKTKNE